MGTTRRSRRAGTTSAVLRYRAHIDEEAQQVSVENAERLLTPGEVALMFRVDPKTVTRWASAGRIGSIRTPGGHRRFRESEVSALLADLTVEASRNSA